MLVPRRESKIDYSTQPAAPHALVIDDDPVAGEIASAMLSVAGCEVHLAQDGRAALSLLDGGCCVPRDILLDAQLPGLSGNHLIAELRARGPSRIWLVSAGEPPPEMTAAADGFLRKPFDSGEILSAVGPGNPNPAQSAPIPQAPAGFPASVLSQEILEQFRRTMPDPSIRRMYAALLADLNRRTRILDAALAADDFDEVRRMGHAIRGGCAMAGAQQAAALGAQLEAIPISAPGNRSALAAAILGNLRTALQSLEDKLKAEFPA